MQSVSEHIENVGGSIFGELKCERASSADSYKCVAEPNQNRTKTELSQMERWKLIYSSSQSHRYFLQLWAHRMPKSFDFEMVFIITIPFLWYIYIFMIRCSCLPVCLPGWLVRSFVTCSLRVGLARAWSAECHHAMNKRWTEQGSLSNMVNKRARMNCSIRIQTDAALWQMSGGVGGESLGSISIPSIYLYLGPSKPLPLLISIRLTHYNSRTSRACKWNLYLHVGSR